MTLRFMTALLCVVFMSCSASVAYASGTANHAVNQLEELSGQIDEYVGADQMNAARSLLNHFISQVNSGGMQAVSAHDREVIVTAAGKLLVALQFSTSPNEVKACADAFYLGMDALTSPNRDPIWVSFRGRMLTLISQLQHSAVAHATDRYQDQFNRFLNDYAIVYPAMIINGNTAAVATIDQQMNKLKEEANTESAGKQQLRMLSLLRQSVAAAFVRPATARPAQTTRLLLMWGALFLLSSGCLVLVRKTAKFR
ncbi:MAG: sporulation protein YpjB [Sporolactobacillus sp.]